MTFPTTPILDNFNRPDENPLNPATWGDIGGALAVFGGECGAPDFASDWGYWLASCGPDCEVFATLRVLPPDGGIVYLTARLILPYWPGYLIGLVRDDVGGDSIVFVPLGLGPLDSAPINLQVGDSWGARLVGVDYEIWYRPAGGAWTPMFTVTDATSVTAGYIGILANDDQVRVDDFGGGVYVAAPAAVVPIRGARGAFDALGAAYQIILRNPQGVMLTVVDDFVSVDYARTVNQAGALTLIVPDDWDAKRNLYSFDLFNRADNRIEIWRAPAGGVMRLDMEAVWFVTCCERKLAEDGKRTIIIKAADAVDLLRRRSVLYASGSAQATVTALEADDALKRIVRENLGNLATETERDLSAYLSVQADLTMGPEVTKAFSRRVVLTVLQELAAAAAQAASPAYLAFDVVYTSETMLEFRTYVSQRGVDRRWPGGQNPVLLDPEQGSIGSLSVVYDYRNEITYVEAGGENQAALRVIKTAQDDARIGQSPFHRIEKFADARNSTADGVQAEANAELRAGRPRRLFSATLLQTPGAAYGIHYGLGDIVSANYIATQFNCRMDSIHITVADGKETIGAALRADELIG